MFKKITCSLGALSMLTTRVSGMKPRPRRALPKLDLGSKRTMFPRLTPGCFELSAMQKQELRFEEQLAERKRSGTSKLDGSSFKVPELSGDHDGIDYDACHEILKAIAAEGDVPLTDDEQLENPSDSEMSLASSDSPVEPPISSVPERIFRRDQIKSKAIAKHFVEQGDAVGLQTQRRVPGVRGTFVLSPEEETHLARAGLSDGSSLGNLDSMDFKDLQAAIEPVAELHRKLQVGSKFYYGGFDFEWVVTKINDLTGVMNVKVNKRHYNRFGKALLGEKANKPLSKGDCVTGVVRVNDPRVQLSRPEPFKINDKIYNFFDQEFLVTKRQTTENTRPRKQDLELVLCGHGAIGEKKHKFYYAGKHLAAFSLDNPKLHA